MDIDLHGYHPKDLFGDDRFTELIKQAWEVGDASISLIHGHGRNRGKSPGFVNTNTGYLGLTVRRALRHDGSLRCYIKHTTLDCHDRGVTTVRLKANPNPCRSGLDDYAVLGRPSFDR